jgi:ferredoxin/flavodoxin---NADP+ reductase
MSSDSAAFGARAEPERPIKVDIAIVGAGPVGLYGAYYAGFRGLTTALIDSLPEPGGQVTALYPEKLIFDVAGFVAIRGRELVTNLVEQAKPFDPLYLLGETASTLQRLDDGTLLLGTDKSTELHAKAVIITGGIGTFSPRPIPVGTEYVGRGIAYFVPRIHDYADRNVLIVGGGDSAFDWAVTLHPIAQSVTLVHRRDRFRAHEHTVRLVRELGVEILVFTEVAEVRGGATVEEVVLRQSKTGEERVMRTDAVVAALGFTADLGPLAEWGLEVERKQIVVGTTMATSLPGIYAAGDIADYPGKVRLISVGFGEAATAVNNAAVAIDPNAHLFPGHSSEAG